MKNSERFFRFHDLANVGEAGINMMNAKAKHPGTICEAYKRGDGLKQGDWIVTTDNGSEYMEGAKYITFYKPDKKVLQHINFTKNGLHATVVAIKAGQEPPVDKYMAQALAKIEADKKAQEEAKNAPEEEVVEEEVVEETTEEITATTETSEEVVEGPSDEEIMAIDQDIENELSDLEEAV